MSKKLSISAFFPCYNEELNVERVVARALEVLGGISDNYEVIIVNDGSKDRTREIADKLAEQNECVRAVHHEVNRGYGGALQSGFAAATKEWVFYTDGDGQFDPSEIPAVVKPILENEADMVQGHRLGFIRPSERFLTWVSSLFGPVGDSGTGFRAGKTDLFRSLELEGRCICGIFSLEVLRRGGRISEVPVSLRPSPKPGNIAWYHVPQLGFLLREAFHLIRVQSGR